MAKNPFLLWALLPKSLLCCCSCSCWLSLVVVSPEGGGGRSEIKAECSLTTNFVVVPFVVGFSAPAADEDELLLLSLVTSLLPLVTLPFAGASLRVLVDVIEEGVPG